MYNHVIYIKNQGSLVKIDYDNKKDNEINDKFQRTHKNYLGVGGSFKVMKNMRLIIKN